MNFTETLILVVYFFVLSILAIYGWHRYYLVYLHKNKGRRRSRSRRWPAAAGDPTPDLYEMFRVSLIDAVCEMVPERTCSRSRSLTFDRQTRGIAEPPFGHAARASTSNLHRVDRTATRRTPSLPASPAAALLAIFDADFIPRATS